MKKTLPLFILIAILIAGFFIFNNFIYNQKQSNPTPEPYLATLQGTYTCLPQKDNPNQETDSECEPAIKTEAGEHYAINFLLVSQTYKPLEIGQSFSANGIVSNNFSSNPEKWNKYELMGIFSVTDSLAVINNEENEENKKNEENDEAYACTMEVRVCSDGSYVGRSGPRCAFDACPTPDTVPTQVTASLGESVTVMNLTISPVEVISDSRCPADVQCVWAGTVEVRTTLSTQVAHGEHVLVLGEPQTFGDYSVTLIEVTPVKTEEGISDGEYGFRFEVGLE